MEITPRHRDALPQLEGALFLTDGGIETSLIYHDGLDLPLFAAFVLLDDEPGTAALRRYYEPYARIAAERGTGFVLETPTWRANPRWAAELGYDHDRLAAANRNAVALMEEIRHAHSDGAGAIVISGCVGPHDDGYQPGVVLTADEAQAYHATQIGTFAGTAADLVTAVTMTYSDEAIGVTRAAVDAGMPVVISFTVETDGRLPSGEALSEAIERVDAETGGAPAYYMVNCAHPTHFDGVLASDGAWKERIRGVRANASMMSHEELDASEELDAGDPVDLGARCAALRDVLPSLNVVGGCCGTDHRHIESICAAFQASPVALR